MEQKGFNIPSTNNDCFNHQALKLKIFAQVLKIDEVLKFYSRQWVDRPQHLAQVNTRCEHTTKFPPEFCTVNFTVSKTFDAKRSRVQLNKYHNNKPVYVSYTPHIF